MVSPIPIPDLTVNMNSEARLDAPVSGTFGRMGDFNVGGGMPPLYTLALAGMGLLALMLYFNRK